MEPTRLLFLIVWKATAASFSRLSVQLDKVFQVEAAQIGLPAAG
jgi:hypothetical protein